MNLVIVESPTKAKTIQKFLTKDYEVVACFGHVRDLPQKEIGIEIAKNYEPKYLIVPKARKIIKEIKDKAKSAQNLYLATDYDREGEAIAWHLMQAAGLQGKSKKEKGKSPNRITFHEITKEAILEAIKNPRAIDLNLVDAQQGRRVLDRLVGYKLSPFLWKKVAKGLSAGRVQSVALRLIVERDKEIEAFKPEEYWTLEAQFQKEAKTFKGILNKIKGQKIEKLAIGTDKEAQSHLKNLEEGEYKVTDIKKEAKKRYPSPPFTTSTLQQEAGNSLHFTARQTMRLAQNLYEEGLITYMRTDSVQVAAPALKMAKDIITEKFGADYALEAPRIYKTKSKGAQEAHEAIRPTNLKITPEELKNEPANVKLYGLIWKRMLASQMKEAEVMEENVEITASDYTFLATGLQVTFPGFYKVIQKNNKENILPSLKIDDKVELEKLEKCQHFTEPPASFTEASLVKELEKRGIGRPSTYAPTISTIIDRGYVTRSEGKLHSEDVGQVVSDVLTKHFPEIMDYNFTAKLEEELDEIAEGKIKWQKVINDFYDPFQKHLKQKTEEVSKQEITEEVSDEKCPECGKALKIKLGRYGKFLACTGFPECKFTKPILDKNIQEKVENGEVKVEKCPKCGKNMVLKEGRFGPFFACEGYPECKTTKNMEIAAKVPCPNCGSKLLRRNTKKGKVFWGCAGYPKCKTAFWEEPQEKPCPLCQNIVTLNFKTKLLKCSQCEWQEKA